MCARLNDASWIRSEPARASLMEFGRPSSAAPGWHAGQTHRILKNKKSLDREGQTAKQLRSSSDNRIRGASALFLRDLWWRFGDGRHARFNPSAGSCGAPRSPLVSAGGFLSPRLRLVCVIQRLQLPPSRLPLSVCSVSLLPERPGALVPPALQWRLSGPGALWWGLPLFNKAVRAHPSRPKRARAWPTMWARVRLYRFTYMCACVRECAQAQMCQWVRLGLKEWVIQQQERSQLLPAPAQLTAAAAMRSETPPPPTMLLFCLPTPPCVSLIHSPLLHQLYRFCIFRAYLKVYGVDSHGGWRQLWHERGGSGWLGEYKLWFNKWDLLYLTEGG